MKSQHNDLVKQMEQFERQYDLYILTDINNVEWIQDGVRLAPETKWFHERFGFLGFPAR